MPKDVPREFYDAVDKFIELANALTKDHNVERISAVILFAAARYNAHCMLATDPSAASKNREAAVSYFVKQYREMLEDNIDRLKAAMSKESSG
jgi:hypothetical protein